MTTEEQRPRSRASSDDWHLVATDGESEGGHSRAMSMHGGSSRPQTPAIHGVDLLDMGTDCPPTPESERLADCLLGTPVAGSATGLALANPDVPDVQASQDLHVDVQACIAGGGAGDAFGLEVVRLTCLQGLSQEGSLEGFALPRTALASVPEEMGVVVAAEEEEVMPPTTPAHAASAPAAGMDELSSMHMDAMDGLAAFLDGLGWNGSALVASVQSSLAELGVELAGVHTAVRARMMAARDTAITLTQQLTARLTQATGGKPATTWSVVTAALGLTTLAALAGILVLMGRCRHLSAQLASRDKELARLVVRILNLQESLQAPRGPPGPPMLRHTSLLAGLVASSLM